VKAPHELLVDAQEMGRTSPTFQVPPQHRLDLIGEAQGTMVKVCLEDESGGERFWVEVMGPPTNGVYTGKVNSPIRGWDVGQGEALFFEARHVYDTLFPGEAP
jgi:hypothetical protein